MTVSSIYLSDQLKARLMQAARRRGFAVELGRQSQLAEYIAYLISLDEQASPRNRPRRTLHRALGLLAQPGQAVPSDAQIGDLLAERRTKK